MMNMIDDNQIHLLAQEWIDSFLQDMARANNAKIGDLTPAQRLSIEKASSMLANVTIEWIGDNA